MVVTRDLGEEERRVIMNGYKVSVLQDIKSSRDGW